MGAMVSEIAGGPADPPLVKGVGTKRLGKGRVKITHTKSELVLLGYFSHNLVNIFVKFFNFSIRVPV